ncbi:hypothetical protein B0H11DRAFT_2221546 [Mycena galericulata]|nr:hypothetical protein B0H11DRAFT_2221546 [Mycena galericulata]
MADMKCELHDLRRRKRNRPSASPPSTPLPKRRRTMHKSSPMDEALILCSSLMATTPERDTIARGVSAHIQRSLRQRQRQDLERIPVAPRPRGKLHRRVNEIMSP